MDNINLEKLIKTEEIDHNVILNVPKEIGLKIQKIIHNSQGVLSEDQLKLEIIQSLNQKVTLEESRKLIFKEDANLHPATLLDLPCIIEAMKTLDSKTYYKAGDISQMLYVHETTLPSIEDLEDFNPFKAKDRDFNKMTWTKDYDHKYKCRSGISKAAKNIRAIRFKPKQRYDKGEIFSVCKKLKNIIDVR